jgi:hypothetical protein
MCRNDHPLDVMICLRVLGANDPAQCIETQIGFLGLAFESQRITLQLVIRGLWALVHEPSVSSDQESMIYYLDDGYDLAVAGSYGTLADIERELVAFVTPYADNLRALYPHLVPSGE